MSRRSKVTEQQAAERACKIWYSCGGCRRKTEFVNTGRFRVNANGNRLDVWLIYQCERCKHTKRFNLL